MRWFVVAILAVGLLAGCGVGLDEQDGQDPGVSAVAQTLEEAPSSAQVGQTPANPVASGGLDGGSAVALPQDPIPLLTSQGLPLPAPVGTFNPSAPSLMPGVPLPPH